MISNPSFENVGASIPEQAGDAQQQVGRGQLDDLGAFAEGEVGVGRDQPLSGEVGRSPRSTDRAITSPTAPPTSQMVW